jgi:hypothetical protein
MGQALLRVTPFVIACRAVAVVVVDKIVARPGQTSDNRIDWTIRDVVAISVFSGNVLRKATVASTAEVLQVNTNR